MPGMTVCVMKLNEGTSESREFSDSGSSFTSWNTDTSKVIGVALDLDVIVMLASKKHLNGVYMSLNGDRMANGIGCCDYL